VRHVLSYRTDTPNGPSDIVAVDRSATTHGKEITSRRWLVHEATVLASRSIYLNNIEGSSLNGVPQ
jgi:hypothetical protein